MVLPVKSFFDCWVFFTKEAEAVYWLAFMKTQIFWYLLGSWVLCITKASRLICPWGRRTTLEIRPWSLHHFMSFFCSRLITMVIAFSHQWFLYTIQTMQLMHLMQRSSIRCKSSCCMDDKTT